jgi:hypothetical protein
MTFRAQITVPPMAYHMPSQVPIIAEIQTFLDGSMTIVVLSF